MICWVALDERLGLDELVWDVGRVWERSLGRGLDLGLGFMLLADSLRLHQTVYLHSVQSAGSFIASPMKFRYRDERIGVVQDFG